ncbi:MAG: VanZ family protein [Phycisphaerales bacterium]|nr:VanZ family protein [Phycisphaerales bacterium]
MTRTRLDRLADALLRHWVETLSVLCILFILANTLVPLDFGRTLPQSPKSRLLQVTFSRIAWTDLSANTALYAPLGFFGAWAARRRHRGGIRSAIRLVAGAGGMSLVTEVAQAFSPSRVSSIVDVVANALGAGLGVGLFHAAARSANALRHDVSGEWRATPLQTRAKAYVLLLLVLGSLPFSVSLDVNRMKDAWKNATWAPFAEYTRTVGSRLAGAPNSALSAAFVQRLHWEHALGDAAEAISFGVLVALLLPMLRIEYQFRRITSVLLTIWFSVLLASILSAIQFVVIGRGFHTTDWLFRMAGAALALVWMHIRPGRCAKPQCSIIQPCTPQTAAMWVMLLSTFIILSGFSPFKTRTGESAIQQAVRSEAFLPFFAYFRGRFDWAMHDLLGKGAAYLLLGASWAAMHHPDINRRSLRRRRPIESSMMIGLTLSVVIETAQVFILSRIPSLTDVLIAMVGCPLGAVAAIGFARLTPRASQERVPSDARGESDSRMPLADQLVGLLLEEAPHAPAETAPPPSDRKPVAQGDSMAGLPSRDR